MGTTRGGRQQRTRRNKSWAMSGSERDGGEREDQTTEPWQENYSSKMKSRENR